jgi:shikimate dehydrogenase
LGMLIGQAAHAYAIWHGVMPKTAQLYRDLRAEIDAG